MPLHGHESPPTRVLFSDDKNAVKTTDASGKSLLWSVPSGQRIDKILSPAKFPSENEAREVDGLIVVQSPDKQWKIAYEGIGSEHPSSTDSQSKSDKVKPPFTLIEEADDTSLTRIPSSSTNNFHVTVTSVGFDASSRYVAIGCARVQRSSTN